MDALFTLIEREELYPFHIQSEGYRNRTRYVFDKYIHFKNLPVREITEDHWLELIDSYINEEKFGTAKNLRTFAGMFYKNAQSNPAYRKLRNPLAGFQIHLPKPKTKKSLTPKQLASVSFDSPLHHAVLQMLIYTGQRAMEILPMRWDRINDEYWIVGEKGEMKAKSSAHYLPMTQTIKDIIEPMKEFGSEWVFPGKDTYLKRNSFLQYLQMHYPGYTMHQFRHTFATLATDKAGIDPYGVQLVLHHTFSDVTHQSYMHGQQLDKKREALEEWARYVENIRVS
jgi:integrase